MHSLTLLERQDEAKSSRAASRASLPDEATLKVECPQESWVIDDPHSRALACCSLWWEDIPTVAGKRAGYIGHYYASDRMAAGRLLDHATRRLAEQGCQLAIGPINGSTWGNYRFVLDGQERLPFFLEPQNPQEWAEDLIAAKFSPAATYVSTIGDPLEQQDARLTEIEHRLWVQGVRLRTPDFGALDLELKRIHELSHAAFRSAFLYREISQQTFAATYLKLIGLVRREHVLLAECDGTLVGFALALPDHAQAQRGTKVDTLILKTLAVRPGRAWAGLGRMLIQEVNRLAVEGGYRNVIHALMREDNASFAYSRRSMALLRRYAVFAKELA